MIIFVPHILGGSVVDITAPSAGILTELGSRALTRTRPATGIDPDMFITRDIAVPV